MSLEQPTFLELIELHFKEAYGLRSVSQNAWEKSYHFNICKNPYPKTMKNEFCKGLHEWWVVNVVPFGDVQVIIGGTYFHAADPECFQKMDTLIRGMNK